MPLTLDVAHTHSVLQELDPSYAQITLMKAAKVKNILGLVHKGSPGLMHELSFRLSTKPGRPGRLGGCL